jgi:hypothetical protein
MRTIEYFALVPSTEEESIKEKVSKEKISKIIDDVFAENNQINNIIKNLGNRINQLKIPKLGFNNQLLTIPPNVSDISKNITNIDQTAFVNFLEIGRMSNINGNFTGKFNFFHFNDDTDIDIKLNANIKNESVDIYDDTTILDHNHLIKKFEDIKFHNYLKIENTQTNVIKIKDVNVKGNINIDIPRFCKVLFLSNISTKTGKLIINLSAPLLIIIHNSNINSNIKYWASKYENTECPKLQCPKVDCPKVECPTLECPKVDCPKVECAKVECAKVECSNYNKIYIGVIISLLLAMFILTFLYLTKKETN